MASGHMGLRLTRTWDVKCPPCKKHMVHGNLIPTVKGAFSGRLMQKSRRMTIEIHGPEPVLVDEKKKSPPPLRGLMHRASEALDIDLATELKDDDRVVIRILKPRKHWGFSRDPEDSSDDDDGDDRAGHEKDTAWVEYRKFGIDEFEDEQVDRNSWEATMGLGASQERREIRFNSDEAAKAFKGQLDGLRSLIKERAEARLAAFQKASEKTRNSIQIASRGLETSLSASSDIELLVEIVSATNLPIADRHSTDPYIVVYMGTHEIHRTLPIPATINPIWSVKNGSLFIVESTAEDFFSYGAGLSFVIKDHDTLSKNEVVGRVELDQQYMLTQTGERVSRKLQIEHHHGVKKSSNHFIPRLHLRIRKAEASDRAFLKQVFAVKKSKMSGIYADRTFLAPRKEKVGFLKKEKKIIDGVKHYRVKPCPDPNRPEHDTKWMSAKAIKEECLKPTVEWTEAGSGTLGKLYFEVINCEGLPNMDHGTPMDKTDAFCCIIYEDAIVNTTVISDELDPCWMPWSNRGFVFNVAHPSSQLLLGIFDYDASAINDNDAIGRVSIDITNFRRNTSYLLTYDLYSSVLANDRKPHGSVTVRLSLQYDSYRNFVKGSMQLPPLNYINLPHKSDFKAAYYVCNGEENLHRFDMNAITAYRTELEQYLDIWYYISRSIVTVLLWRGHYDIHIRKFKIALPLHSMVAFVLGIHLIENLNLLPSCFFFAIAWLLLATNEHRKRNPSPWHQTMTYRHMWYAVLVNEAPPVHIADHENEAVIKAYNEEVEARHQRILEEKKQTEKLLGVGANEDIVTTAATDEAVTQLGVGGPTLNPMAVALFPIQQILGQVCVVMRIIKSVVLWDESLYAFLIVNICLLLGFMMMWMPWEFVVRWTYRVLIWVFLGPWMKLFDIFYVQKLFHHGESEEDAFKRLAKAKIDELQVAREAQMLLKEEETKLRAMKRFMFGQFMTQVPQLKEYRYSDTPKAESSATPINDPIEHGISKKSSGQALVGTMIPVWGGAVYDAEKKAEP